MASIFIILSNKEQNNFIYIIFSFFQKNRPSDYLENLNIPVLIISYEMFMRGYSDIKNIDFDLVICDEGHRLKNCSIKTTTVRTLKT